MEADPSSTYQGPTKAVTAAAIDSSGTFFAGSYDGRIMAVTANGTVEPVSGSGHSNHVSGITCTDGKKMSSVAFDDTLREFVSGKFDSASLSTAGQPKGIAGADDGTVFVATVSAVEAAKAGKKVANLKVAYTPSSIAVSGRVVAVGAEVSACALVCPSQHELTICGG